MTQHIHMWLTKYKYTSTIITACQHTQLLNAHTYTYRPFPRNTEKPYNFIIPYYGRQPWWVTAWRKSSLCCYVDNTHTCSHIHVHTLHIDSYSLIFPLQGGGLTRSRVGPEGGWKGCYKTMYIIYMSNPDTNYIAALYLMLTHSFLPFWPLVGLWYCDVSYDKRGVNTLTLSSVG